MFTRRSAMVGAAALALAAAGVGVSTATTAAGAGVTTTYSGVFTGPLTFVGCAPAPPAWDASGHWTVAEHGTDTGTLTVSIKVNGKHHVSFGGVVPQAGSGPDLVLGPIPTAAGMLTVTVAGGAMSYRIADYVALDGSFSCPGGSVTYHGVVTGR